MYIKSKHKQGIIERIIFFYLCKESKQILILFKNCLTFTKKLITFFPQSPLEPEPEPEPLEPDSISSEPPSQISEPTQPQTIKEDQQEVVVEDMCLTTFRKHVD